MTVGGMGFIPERLLMMMMMNSQLQVRGPWLIVIIIICFILVPVSDSGRYGIYE